MLASEEGEFEEVERDTLIKAWPEADDAGSEIAETAFEADELLPPLHKLLQSDASEAPKAEDDSDALEMQGAANAYTVQTITIVAHLDRKFPLTEAKWVRSGKPDEWIETISAPSAPSAGRAVAPNGQQQASPESAWIGKIKVVDPEAVRLSSSSLPRRQVKGCGTPRLLFHHLFFCCSLSVFPSPFLRLMVTHYNLLSLLLRPHSVLCWRTGFRLQTLD